jgi:hypothetical protein
MSVFKLARQALGKLSLSEQKFLLEELALNHGEKKTAYHEETTTDETGRVKSNTVRKKVRQEPDYFKVYIRDLAALMQLPSGDSSILFMLAKRMTYDGEISVTKRIKEEIAEDMRTKPSSIGNALTRLVEKQILMRIGRGEYAVNPRYIARGKWEDIRYNRSDFDVVLKLTYSQKGREIKAGTAHS